MEILSSSLNVALAWNILIDLQNVLMFVMLASHIFSLR